MTGLRRDQVRGLESFAYRDVVEALPKGVVAYDTIESSSSALVDNDVADWLLDEVSVDSSRLYAIHLHSAVQLSAAARWTVEVRADASTLALLDTRIPSDTFYTVDARVLWKPSTGTPDLDIQVHDVLSTGGTHTFLGSSTNPRSLWVEDIGPR